MPASVVRTKEDEVLWKQAKALARKEGREDDFAYITAIYKRSKKNGSLRKAAADEKKARVKNYLEKYD